MTVKVMYEYTSTVLEEKKKKVELSINSSDGEQS